MMNRVKRNAQVVANRRSRLRQWIDDRYGGVQARFVEESGINQGELSGLLKDKTFGENRARSLEDAVGMPPGYLDQGDGATTEIEPGNDHVAIRRGTIKLAAGISGYAIEWENHDAPPIFFRREWFSQKGLIPGKLIALKVNGASMEPGLFDGNLVVVNMADTTPADGEVFAVDFEGEPVIKRLKRDGGEWWLSSDNSDKRRYPDKRCGEGVAILGRIVLKQSEVI